MNFPKYRNIEDLIKNQIRFISEFFDILFEFRKKCAFFKVVVWAQINVHFIGLDFRNPAKFIL